MRSVSRICYCCHKTNKKTQTTPRANHQLTKWTKGRRMKEQRIKKISTSAISLLLLSQLDHSGKVSWSTWYWHAIVTAFLQSSVFRLCLWRRHTEFHWTEQPAQNLVRCTIPWSIAKKRCKLIYEATWRFTKIAIS